MRITIATLLAAATMAAATGKAQSMLFFCRHSSVEDATLTAIEAGAPWYAHMWMYAQLLNDGWEEGRETVVGIRCRLKRI